MNDGLTTGKSLEAQSAGAFGAAFAKGEGPRRVLLIGINGSGKSVLADQLAPLLGLPLTRIDDLNWSANWVAADEQELRCRVAEIAEKERWLIDGNNPETLDLRLRRADLVIWLDFNPLRSLAGVLWRDVKWTILRQRKSLPAGVRDGGRHRRSFTMHARQWAYVARFSHRTRPRIEKLLFQFNVPVIRLHNRRQVAEFLEFLQAGEPIHATHFLVPDSRVN